jgi:hypothetical protein
MSVELTYELKISFGGHEKLVDVTFYVDDFVEKVINRIKEYEGNENEYQSWFFDLVYYSIGVEDYLLYNLDLDDKITKEKTSKTVLIEWIEENIYNWDDVIKAICENDLESEFKEYCDENVKYSELFVEEALKEAIDKFD